MNTTVSSGSSLTEPWSRRCSIETIYSVQGAETDVVRDTSDTEAFASDGERSASDDDVEYELATEPEEEDPPVECGDSSGQSDNDIIATRVVEVSVGDDGDLHFADGEGTDSDAEADDELDPADYWRCAQCRAANNNPLYRYCEKCYKVRKSFFPPRPRPKRKRNASMSRTLSQDSGVYSQGQNDQGRSQDLSGQNDQGLASQSDAGLLSQNDLGLASQDDQGLASQDDQALLGRNDQDSPVASDCLSFIQNCSELSSIHKSGHDLISSIDLDRSSVSHKALERCLSSDKGLDHSSVNQNGPEHNSISLPSHSYSELSVSGCQSSTSLSINRTANANSFKVNNLSAHAFNRSHLKRRAESPDRATKRWKVDGSHSDSSSCDASDVAPIAKTVSDPAITVEDTMKVTKKIVSSSLKEKVENDNMCIMCFSEPKSGVFVHGAVAHICCCYKCAMKVWVKAKRCPICNSKVSNVLKAIVM